MRLSKLLSLLALAVAPTVFALDDIPVYYDAGCTGTGVPKWYVGGSANANLVYVPYTTQYSTGNTLPIDCVTKHTGTDAVKLNVTANVGTSGYYDIVMKFADDKFKYIGNHTDIRFWAKNMAATPAKLRPIVQSTAYSNTWTTTLITVPASSDWTEYTVPISSFTGSTGTAFRPTVDSLVGFGFTYSWNAGDTPTGSAMDLRIDDIRVTDGTAHNPLQVPVVGGGTIPVSWPSYLVLGSFDNKSLTGASAATQAEQAGDYRYNYIMPETMQGTWGSSTYTQDYMEKSVEFGKKTAFVWYHLGKVGESIVATNLADATFMTQYVDWYEEFLTEIKTVMTANPTQAPVIIVLEPDMYGKLMQQNKMPNMNAAEVPVYMTRANTVTGTTYAANLAGWAQYMVGRAKSVLGQNNVIIGHMLNHWGVNIPGQVGQGRLEAHIMGGYAQGNFLNSLGTAKGDVVFVEKTDRDAGVKLTEQPTEDWFWTDSNYTNYFGWVKCLSVRSGLRVVGWQVSEGNSHHPANNQDDAIEHFLAHSQAWADAGFIGILFGAGMGGNANYPQTGDNDGGWFVSQVNAYSAKPQALTAILTTATLPSVARSNGTSLQMHVQNGMLLWSDSKVIRVELLDLQGRRHQVVGGSQLGLRIPNKGLWIWRALTSQGVQSGSILSIQ